VGMGLCPTCLAEGRAAPGALPAEPAAAPAAAASPPAPPAAAPAPAPPVPATVDPLSVPALAPLAARYDIGITSVTPGDGVSRVVIGSVNGEPVSPTNIDARDLAQEMAALDASSRPRQMGTPWRIAGDGFVTDAELRDRIEIELPATAAAPAPEAPAYPHPAPAANGDPASAGRASAVFGAVTGSDAPDARIARPNTARVMPAVPDPAPAPQGQPAPVPGTPPSAAVDPSAPDPGLAASAGPYPGDGAPKEQVALWMARTAQAAGLPPELPVMAALVESGLSNLDHGHADSLGFFQMRESVWNTGDYAGYADSPELQMKWFIDQAAAIKRKRLDEGLAAFGTDPAGYGEWIADVERPAEQYRGRYQERLEQARELLTAAGARP